MPIASVKSCNDNNKPAMDNMSPQDSLGSVAVIGMVARVPGAKNVDEFWRNLCKGVEPLQSFTDEELESSGVDPVLLRDPHYVKAGTVLDDIEMFDAAFFGYTPREAERMDPQHRLFLEGAWTALEQAGYDAHAYQGSIGVYAGASLNTYLLNNLFAQRGFVDSMDDLQTLIGGDKDFLTTRVSYQLNLKGPSMAVQTTCSTSLVAICQACQSLVTYQCDMALAGGVSVRVPQKRGYLHQPSAIFSPDGHCRAFDAKAQGTIFGNGLGIVVLKRLADALADGDTVHAVIRGWAINNDGSSKVGYTAPSVNGQAEVIALAQAIAGVHPETVTYIEAHGTGTELGDPIEIAALTQAFRAKTAKKGFCAVGTVKSNFGHLDTAAGVAGFIKTALAVRQGLIPPSLHFERPNPNIDFQNSPFFVNAALRTWETDGHPRRAGVSSFGIGGTNAHVVLEEPPVAKDSSESRSHHLLLLSAKTNTALETATHNLVDHFKGHPDLNLADVAHTLHVGRREFNHRRMIVCRDLPDAVAALETRDPKRVFTGLHETAERPIAFMFPGQGAQYINMGLELYHCEPVFREHVEACSEQLNRHLNIDLRGVLYPREADAGTAAELLKQTQVTQPALFVIEYALARLFMAWGIQPRAMIGHSIGEYVAATLAGVFSLPDAMAVVAARGRLMGGLPGGKMLAVPLPAAEVESLLTDGLALAAVNGPALCVVSGPAETLDRWETRLSEQGIAGRSLHTSHAFHSSMMDGILDAFTERVKNVRLNTPQIPFISNVSGAWITNAEATDPAYWAKHLRRTVRFADGIHTLCHEPSVILLEVGPGRTLSTLANLSLRQTHAASDGLIPKRPVIASMRHPQESESDLACLLNALGKLWLSGAAVDWRAFHAGQRRHRVPLPTYPFERRRFWVDPPGREDGHAVRPALSTKDPDMANWFYVPSWKRTAALDTTASTPRRWLIFGDDGGVGAWMVNRLTEQGHDVCVVGVGNVFFRVSERVYSINPADAADYETLVKSLRADGKLPDRIVHLWGVSAPRSPESGKEHSILERALSLGLFSLLHLVEAVEHAGATSALDIAVVTNGVHDVTGAERLVPERATVLGACNVIPQEHPHITVRNIDIEMPESGEVSDGILDRLTTELGSPSSDPVTAYRGHHRWTRLFEPVPLKSGPQRPARLRQEGIYLITGGLGGIGLELAEYLFKTAGAKLVLTGRRGLPEPKDWDAYLATHEESDDTVRRIRKVRALQARGADVLVIAADVTDADGMGHAFHRAKNRFGGVHGVIHAAGTIDTAYSENVGTGARAALAPKVQGTWVVDELAREFDVDFLILCSSLASLTGGWGLPGYSAANAFLDAFAHRHQARQRPFTLSINWDVWSDVGMVVNAVVPAERKARHQDILSLGLRSSEGVEVFHRILHTSHPQVIVSTLPLTARMEEWRRPVSTSEGDATAAPGSVASAPAYVRPLVSSSFVAPRNEIERILADIWTRLLGIAQVGINDDFFELGGHSLLATQLLNRLRQPYPQAKLSLRLLFDNPTVARLAELIAAGRRTQDTVDEPVTRDRLLGAPPEQRRDLIRVYLRRQIAQALGADAGRLPLDDGLRDLDAGAIVKNLIWVLKRDFDLPVYPPEIQQRLSLEALAQFVDIELQRTSGLVPVESSTLPHDARTPPGCVQNPGMKSGAWVRDGSISKNKSMIFVLGAPRSGSTLLRVMLSGHSGLFCPPELWLLDHESLRPWSDDPFSLYCRDGLIHAFMPLIHADFETSKVFVDELVERDVAVPEVYRMIQQRAAPRLLVDKTPGYALRLDTLQKAEALFDKARYLVLLRHPYAVIDSFVRHRFDKLRGEEGDSYAIAERYWRQCYDNIRAFGKTVDPRRLHTLRYEDLVRDPRRVMIQVCEFLGLPFEEAVVLPYENGQMVVGPGDPNLLRHDAIDPGLADAWKRVKLPRPLTEAARRLATEMGYDLPEPQVATLSDEAEGDFIAEGRSP